jgi:platelet-activating factor acetylhydrolase IB subunit beta/gamma
MTLLARNKCQEKILSVTNSSTFTLMTRASLYIEWRRDPKMANSSIKQSDGPKPGDISQGAMSRIIAAETASGKLQGELIDALPKKPDKPHADPAERPARYTDAPSDGLKSGTPGLLPDWNERHQALVHKAQSTNPEVAFYGDSITEAMHLNNSFRTLFNGKAENFGIHSDTTDNLRYRLLNGEASFADGKDPKDVVIHIGTNDLGKKSATAIANDIFSDAMLAHQKLPDSQILVVGLMPRPGFETDVSEVNRILGQRVQRQHDSSVHFADIGASMPENAPGIWQPGGLHPTFGAGYTRMLGAIKDAMDKQL